MKYKESITQNMNLLAKDTKRVFIGYNVAYGSRAYGTLTGIPEGQLLEMPVAENLMLGIGLGLCLEGFKPVIFFERHDFLLNAMDMLVNHVDKLAILCEKQPLILPIIIRAVVGTNKPINPGLQHTQDYTEELNTMLKTIPVHKPYTPNVIKDMYKKIKNSKYPRLIIEYKRFWELEI